MLTKQRQILARKHGCVYTHVFHGYAHGSGYLWERESRLLTTPKELLQEIGFSKPYHRERRSRFVLDDEIGKPLRKPIHAKRAGKRNNLWRQWATVDYSFYRPDTRLDDIVFTQHKTKERLRELIHTRHFIDKRKRT